MYNAHAHVQVSMHVYADVNMHVRTHVLHTANTCPYTRPCPHTCPYSHLYTCPYTHVHAHVYIYVDLHTYTHGFRLSMDGLSSGSLSPQNKTSRSLTNSFFFVKKGELVDTGSAITRGGQHRKMHFGSSEFKSFFTCNSSIATSADDGASTMLCINNVVHGGILSTRASSRTIAIEASGK